MVPKDMRGKVLYPLNQLKTVYPDLYKSYVGKYSGREKLIDRVIPTLNCLWNDVLHFSAVPPEVVREALREAGAESKSSFFQIDSTTLDWNRMVVYLYSKNRIHGDLSVDSDEWEAFDTKNIDCYNNLNQDTKEYYREKVLLGERPLLFHRVPHILFRGSMNVEHLSVV